MAILVSSVFKYLSHVNYDLFYITIVIGVVNSNVTRGRVT